VDVLRDLPTDIENEKNLIWCLLRKPDLLRDDSLSFSVEDFHFSPHKRIVRAIIDLDRDGIVPDPGMVRNRLEDPSDHDYLDALINDMWASPSNAKFYAEKLREGRVRRRAIFDADKLTRAANSGVPEDIARVYEELSIREDPDQGEFPVIRPSVAFSKILPPPVYVLPSLRPRTLGLIVAQEGVGKSFLALEIGLAKATGYDLTGIGIAGPGGAIYFSKEDPEEIIEERLQSIAPFIPNEGIARADGLEIVSLYGKPATLASEKSVVNEKLIRQIIKTGSGKDLLIFDTLRKLHDLEENSSGEMKVLLEIFDRIALETGAAVLLIHHTNKSANLNGQQGDQSSARGSNAIVGNTRWSLHLETVKDDSGKKRIKVSIPRASYGPEGGEWWLERTDGGVLVTTDPPENKPVVVDRTGKLKYPENGGEYEDPFADL
jgi:hypothetical protein